MKKCYLLLSSAITCIIISVADAGAQPQRQSVPDRDPWYRQVTAKLDESAYRFRPAPQTNTYLAANAMQRLSCVAGGDGYTLRPLSISGAPWEIRFAFSQGSAASGKGRAKGQELLFSSGSPDIQYLSNAEGIRQNFIYREKPASGPLKAKLKVTTVLKASVEGNQLSFYDPENPGRPVLLYDGLKAWDASGRVLPASMQLDGDLLSLNVDDRNAVYPVTIDPLSHTPEWTTSANGLLSSLPQTQVNTALYGYQVAFVGDVNNDGFGDVAVTAPGLADIITGSGNLSSVGAVYIFHGSAAGLSATPSNVLQPNTAVDGALFGFSIAGADLNNDGYSDLIIGAPMDQATISAGPGITLDGTVGKVYVYSGATLTTSNPAYLLSFSLASAGLLNSFNISNNALFGFSVGTADDLNGDGKREILVGAPTYASGSVTEGLGAKTGGAFVFTSNPANTYTTASFLNPPTFSELGISVPAVNSIDGLLFGYSVDGAGDYNKDGHPDVVVGAPAGVNLSSLTGIINGQVLAGQAYVFYGNNAGTGINGSNGKRLQSANGGLLNNAANLFGFKVKGQAAVSGVRTGNVLVGSPMDGTIMPALGLTVQSGAVDVFLGGNMPGNMRTADQSIETPRSNSILNVLGTLQLNLLFGASLDNAGDINCDGIPDLVVGEPLSSGTGLPQLQVNAVGGSAHVYKGLANGTYNTTPAYSTEATYGSEFSSANATALFGYSVAGLPGSAVGSAESRVLVGSPSGALDFSSGVLDLGATIGTALDFAIGDNGPGKAYSFFFNGCAVSLPVELISFTGTESNGAGWLNWKTANELNLKGYTVQRSGNGRDWSALSTMPATNAGSYQYIDERPLSGDNYYRLQMADVSGAYRFSQTVKLHFDGGLTARFYPTPATDACYYVPAGSGAISLRICNVAGVTVADRQLAVQAGVPVSLGQLPAGNYIVHTTDEQGNTETGAIVFK